jgi:DNA mismatch repair ATPase MutS
VVLQELYNQIEPITPFSHSISKLNDIGYMLQCYYEIHSNPEYGASLQYSMKFEGYINNILGVYDNLAACSVSFATFDTDADVVMKEQYYPPYKHDKYITNTCKFNKNMVITGPNAAGKTTLLKSTCINIIMTQQFGCGYYSSCCINPYTHIHSYLNIPDTSGRDSLFQAETRRCKEILDIIQDNQGTENRHFCIFDELYSGTNPVEATKAAYSFLLYLTKYTNVNFMLTTHYISICKKIKKNKESRIRNYKMDIVFDKEGKIKYTYKMIRGISNVQGAVRILEEFAYPDEIIQNVLNYKNL